MSASGTENECMGLGSPLNEELAQLIIPGSAPGVWANYASLKSRAEDFCLSLDEPEFVILDTETTGFSAQTDAIIEVAAVVVRGTTTLDTFSTFVNPGRPIPPHITELTHISNEDVAAAPDSAQVMEELVAFCGSRPVVAHNAPFDQAFILANLPRDSASPGNTPRDNASSGNASHNNASPSSASPGNAPQKVPLTAPDPWIDTVSLARIALPLLREYKLETLSATFAPLVRSTHRAIDDVLALVRVWRVILVALSDLPEGLPALLAHLNPGQSWGNRVVLELVARWQEAQCTQGKPRFDLAKVRNDLTLHLREQQKTDAAELEGGILTLKPVEHAKLAQEYTESGLLGKMYPHYEPRTEQLTMATATAKALSNGQLAVIEAGTGVGKSMAYLLPLALFAKKNGISCGVATTSNALLDQLMYHELPRLSAALEAQGAGALQYLALKGYEHYPCVRKLLRPSSAEHTYAGAPDLFAQLLSYVCQSVSGDLDALQLYRGEVPRFEYQASADDCLGFRCSLYRLCLLHSMRRQARHADIIVTNHSLLFCDVMTEGSLLPPVRHWVIDEAHNAEAEARRQLSCELGARTVGDAVRAALKGGGLVDLIRSKAAATEGGGVVLALATKAATQADPVDALTSSFFSTVADLANLAEASEYYRIEMRIDAYMRQSAKWGAVLAQGRSLMSMLEKLVSSLRELILAMNEDQGFLELQSTLSGHTLTLSDALAHLRLILDGSDTSYYYEVELDRRSHQGASKLKASYYDIGSVLTSDFYPNQLAVLYTSATIALGKLPEAPGGPAPGRQALESRPSEKPAEAPERLASPERQAPERLASPAADFSYFLHGVGLDLPQGMPVTTLKLDSSYNFNANMTVFVPTTMVAPNNWQQRELYLEQLDELLFKTHQALGGSVLTLFTNRREMEEAFARLRPGFEANGLEVICQRSGISRTQLRERFIAQKALSLFALRSFWEGFDAPGDTLRCVIIPKLPFGRPNDPLQLEREARERGAWGRYTLPQAIISLKQAAGRLIRSSTDQGFLVLADSRLVSKGYGKQFLAALPSQNIHYLSSEAIAERVHCG